MAFGGREHLIAIAPATEKNSRGLMAYTLRYAEELRAAKDYFGSIPEHAIDKKQLALANDLIRTQSAPFHLQDFKDDYEAALRELIDAKRTQIASSCRRIQAPRQGHQPHGCLEAERRRVEPRTKKSEALYFPLLKEWSYTGQVAQTLA